MAITQQVEVVVVLDRSGSMTGLKNDTIGGFNSFVDTQKAILGRVNLTLVQFNHEYQIDYIGKPIGEVPKLDEYAYMPGGSTALLDALGRAIAETDKRLQDMTEKPKVIFVVVTDGEENASHEYKKAVVKNTVESRQTAGWEFMFLGANIDAFAEGGAIGIRSSSSVAYMATPMGTKNAFKSASYYVVSNTTGNYNQATAQSVSDGKTDLNEALTDALKDTSTGQAPVKPDGGEGVV